MAADRSAPQGWRLARTHLARRQPGVLVAFRSGRCEIERLGTVPAYAGGPLISLAREEEHAKTSILQKEDD
jgi:hypothetical protein